MGARPGAKGGPRESVAYTSLSLSLKTAKPIKNPPKINNHVYKSNSDEKEMTLNKIKSIQTFLQSKKIKLNSSYSQHFNYRALKHPREQILEQQAEQVCLAYCIDSFYTFLEFSQSAVKINNFIK